MKKSFISLVVIFVFTFVFSSCRVASVEETTYTITETQMQTTAEAVFPETTASYYETTAEAVTESGISVIPETLPPEIITVPETSAVVETLPPEIVTIPETTATNETQIAEIITEPVIVTRPATTEAVKEDASSWDKERVVEFYKNAAEITGASVKSQQTVGLQDISVNNGQLSGVFSFVTPILSSFLSSSITETDGITGDFRSLTPADVSSARAYESTNGTVVEITLNSQTDNASEDRNDGSVAHGISVVADLPSIMSQLKEKGLPIDIALEKTVLEYTDPVIKAVVDKDGKIVSGTWSCTVEISLSDYKFAGSNVDSTVVVLDNKITVNGGFNI